jgi:hypothetical protein
MNCEGKNIVVNNLCIGHRGNKKNKCQYPHSDCAKLQYYITGFCRQHKNGQDNFKQCIFSGCTSTRGVTKTNHYCYSHRGGIINHCKGAVVLPLQ